MMETDMKNGADKVLEVLKARQNNDADENKLTADIERARVMLLCYCNIPLNAEMPQGLFEAWCMAAEQLSDGVSGDIASISEGDVSIAFKKQGCEADGLDWKCIADRFRRMAV